MILANISCTNRTVSSLFDEKAMISHDIMEIKLMHIKVVFLPNLSKKYPETKPPIGLEIAVTDANHEACETVNLTSVLYSFNNGRVVAG